MHPRQTRSRLFLSGLAFCLTLLQACGGGSSGGSGSQVTADFPVSAASLLDSNVAAITVESGPGNNVNIPYVSVTLCVPGSTTNCKTVDHILLDTGSTGLRLFSGSLASAPALTLPAHQIGASSTITECAQFLNAISWGPVKVADVVIGGERASSVPVQLMDTNLPAALRTICGPSPVMAAPGASGSNLSNLSANGILGLGLFSYDGQNYFNCTTSVTCQITPFPGQQVRNPVALLTVNNNGVVVQLPSIIATGTTSANGYLILGVDTQSNNRLGTAKIVPVNASGYFTTTYKGKALRNSFMDSGSNGLFFDDATLSTSCNSAASGFYCPGSTQNLTAGIQLAGSVATVNFSIANADNLFGASGNFAFNNLGGTLNSTSFDWGLPFFYGRSVYTIIENRSAGGNTGPFYAYTN